MSEGRDTDKQLLKPAHIFRTRFSNKRLHRTLLPFQVLFCFIRKSGSVCVFVFLPETLWPQGLGKPGFSYGAEKEKLIKLRTLVPRKEEAWRREGAPDLPCLGGLHC